MRRNKVKILRILRNGKFGNFTTLQTFKTEDNLPVRNAQLDQFREWILLITGRLSDQFLQVR